MWRRFANPTNTQSDALMFVISNDGGMSFSKPAVLSNLCSFTQNTTAGSFRSTTHPFVTFDGKAFHAVWAARQGSSCPLPPNAYSRIMISDMKLQGSTVQWSAPRPVDTSTGPRGHEFMPSLVASGNRLLVSWLDTRNDLRPANGPFPDPSPDPYINDYLFAGKTKARRRAADIYAAQALVGQTPAFGDARKVSRYLTGVFPGDEAAGPQVLERNKVNARMFQNGKVPFHGDYISAAAVRFVLTDAIGKPGQWVSSAGVAGVQPILHLAWTDNRLVRGNVSANLNDPNSTTPYTPPSISSVGESDPTTPRTGCVAATVENAIRPCSRRGCTLTILVSPSASKPTKNAAGAVVGRAYSVYVQNTRPADRSVANGNALRLKISGMSGGGTASFRQEDPPLGELTQVEVAARSRAARTVFVLSPALRPVVKIEAYDGPNLVATTYINGNPNAAPLEDALDETGDIPDNKVGQIELHSPDFSYRATSVIGTPAIDDPAIDDPAIDDPAIYDPAIDDPAIDDPAIYDPAD